MSHGSTVSEWSLPWDGDDNGESDAESGVCLVIAWALEEPDRIGELAFVGQGITLGRGEASPDDPFPRAGFARVRPFGPARSQPLTTSRISRLQLEAAPDPGGIRIRCHGKCPVLVRGERVSEAVVEPGQAILLQSAFVLLVASRPRRFEPLASYPPELAFHFGEADPHGIVGESPAAWKLRERLAFAARSDRHVLIHGVSGAGKELAARAVHGLSGRSHRPLVARNAATFPEGLVDAELFGNAKGYPNTGTPERPGLIGEADGGSLFLDEIGELPPHLQAHLLRVLDRDGEYQRLGEARVRRSDVRLIAATNRNLEELKHDFLARFAIRVEIPRLEERREDIPLLVRHLLRVARGSAPETAGRYFDGVHARIEPALTARLVEHRYRHQVRELDRLLWLAMSTSPAAYVALTSAVEEALEASFNTQSEASASEPSSGAIMEASPPRVDPKQLDEATLRSALASADGNVTLAAQRLGLSSRFVLYRLLKRAGISVREDEGSTQ